jgi:hypothetical protein
VPAPARNIQPPHWPAASSTASSTMPTASRCAAVQCPGIVSNYRLITRAEIYCAVCVTAPRSVWMFWVKLRLVLVRNALCRFALFGPLGLAALFGRVDGPNFLAELLTVVFWKSTPAEISRCCSGRSGQRTTAWLNDIKGSPVVLISGQIFPATPAAQILS